MPGLGDAIDGDVAQQDGKDPRFKKLEDLVRELHADGVDFHVERGELFLGRPASAFSADIRVPQHEPDHVRIGVVSDTHLGSVYEQLSGLHDFYRIGENEGVDLFLHPGDLTQGTPKMHRGMEHEVHLHSAEGQVNYTIDVYPKASVKTYVITGNHDDSWINESGINVVRMVANAREDIEYVGRDSCYLDVNGLRTYIVHPDGGSSYAKSYRPQKLVEALPEREKVQLAVVGHYHTYGTFKIQNTQVVMQPCFQGQYPWLVRKALFPTIGGTIIDIRFDGDRIINFTHTLIEYTEVKQDWNRDVSYAHSRPSGA